MQIPIQHPCSQYIEVVNAGQPWVPALQNVIHTLNYISLDLEVFWNVTIGSDFT